MKSLVILSCLLLGAQSFKVFKSGRSDSSVLSSHENFCVDLVDYKEPTVCPETKTKCTSTVVEVCEEVEVTECMDVPVIDCTVELFATCKNDQEDTEMIQTEMTRSEFEAKECEQLYKEDTHTKTLPDCKNVTKQQCTSLWETNEDGEQVFVGEENCKPVTWVECELVDKEVPVQVPYLECKTNNIISYPDVENSTVPVTLNVHDYDVSKETVCKTGTQRKCGSTSYNRCQEKVVTSCEDVQIEVPCQEELHKQWCLAGPEHN